MSAKTNDTLYLAAGGLALLGSCAWAFFQQSDISAFHTAITPPTSGSTYEATPVTLTSAESSQWAGPGSQSAGATWLFDVFTPPVIYYNVDNKQFTVTVPVRKVGGGVVVPTPAQRPDLELVKVDQPLFRLQLVGWIGEGATARGNFENQLTGKVTFAAAGKKIPELNLEVVSFSAERRRIPVQGGTELVIIEATAVVRDTVTGVETPLDAKVRATEGPLTVTLKKADGTPVVAKTGDAIKIGDFTYTVGALQLTPPSAVVVKTGGKLSAPRTETLVIPPPPLPPVPASAAETNPALPTTEAARPKPAAGGFSGF